MTDHIRNALIHAVADITGEQYDSAESALLDLGELMNIKPHAFNCFRLHPRYTRTEYRIPNSSAIATLFDTSVELWRNQAELDHGQVPLIVQYIDSDFGMLL